MRLKFLGISLVFISIALSQLAIYKLDKKLTKRSKCPEEILARLNAVNTQVHPDKIVLKPWKGRHHAHAVFILPSEDKSSKMLVVHIPGAGTFCGGRNNYDIGTQFEGIQAKPGYYLIKTNFRTRTAIWLMARGFATQLQDSQNWRLMNY